MKTQTLELIHYGTDEYRPEEFQPIKDDRNWVKPSGGLWTSPADSKWGWRQWCEAEDFYTGRLEWSVRLRFTGKVLTIDTLADLKKLPWREVAPGVGLHYPLWKPIADSGVDAIHLTVRGQERTRFSKPLSLYGWDCETVLVMNPASIAPVGEKNHLQCA